MSKARTGDGHNFTYGGLDAPVEVVRDFLSALEQEESKLLTWGVVDGGFLLDDVVERARDFLDIRADLTGITASALVDTLLRQRLLFDFALDGRRIYRTRMAESV